MRLDGLDAPELDQTCTRPDGEVWACGHEARDFLAAALRGNLVSCARRGTDRYGRTLARCRVAGADLGAEIVEAGWAVTQFEYRQEESRARSSGLGIWSGEFETPADWRVDSGSPNAFWAWLRRWFG